MSSFFRPPPPGTPGEAPSAQRNMAAHGWAYTCLSVPASVLRTPTLGTLDHTCPGATHVGEVTGGMVNDYPGNRLVCATLLEIPEIASLMETIWTKDCRVACERGWRRNRALQSDMTTRGRENIVANSHTDALDAAGKFTVFKTTRDIGLSLRTETAVCPPGQLGVIVLNQGLPHSIPVGGNCHGWYLSPMSPEKHSDYQQATMVQFAKEREKVLQPRPGVGQAATPGDGEKAVYAWPAMLRMPSPTWQKVHACIIAFGLRPMLYPSHKIVNIPPPYAAKPYTRYTGYRPDPRLQVVDPAPALAELDKCCPEVAVHFRAVAAAFPGQKWACNPGVDIGRAYLVRTFG